MKTAYDSHKLTKELLRYMEVVAPEIGFDISVEMKDKPPVQNSFETLAELAFKELVYNRKLNTVIEFIKENDGIIKSKFYWNTKKFVATVKKGYLQELADNDDILYIDIVWPEEEKLEPGWKTMDKRPLLKPWKFNQPDNEWEIGTPLIVATKLHNLPRAVLLQILSSNPDQMYLDIETKEYISPNDITHWMEWPDMPK